MAHPICSFDIDTRCDERRDELQIAISGCTSKLFFAFFFCELCTRLREQQRSNNIQSEVARTTDFVTYRVQSPHILRPGWLDVHGCRKKATLMGRDSAAFSLCRVPHSDNSDNGLLPSSWGAARYIHALTKHKDPCTYRCTRSQAWQRAPSWSCSSRDVATQVQNFFSRCTPRVQVQNPAYLIGQRDVVEVVDGRTAVEL